MGKRVKKSAAWRKFEREVGHLYRELGARDVEVDKDVAGNQIDVFAVVPHIDGTYSRNIVSCKCYGRNAGVKDVREWHEVFQSCFHANAADHAVIVTNREFSRQAKTLAEAVGIHLRTFEQLKWANVDLSPYLDELSGQHGAEVVFRDRVYVPLRFIREGREEEVSEDDLISHFLADASCPLLTILGDYGAGKTTLSKSIFLRQSEKVLAGDSGSRIPIYMDLRDYPGHLNVQGFILDVLVNQHNARCPNFAKIRHLIDAGKILLIFDAFDEMVTRGSYSETLKNFREILRVLNGKSKAILTCRTHFFKSPHEVHDVHGGTELFRVSAAKKYEIAYIQPLSTSEIEKIIKASCGDSADAALECVRSTYDLMGLARRPILLQMITAVIDELIDSTEPVNNAKLYNHYVNQWLHRDDWRVRLHRKRRRAFTIAFATEMYIQGKLQCTLAELRDAIRRHFPEANQELLEDYDNDVRVCSFIRLNGDEFEFVHRSFMEYFVALQLYGDIVDGDPERLSTVRFSHEILSFLSQQFATNEVRTTAQAWLENTKGNEILAANTIGLLTAWEPRLTGTIHGLKISADAHANSDLTDCNLTDIVATDLKWESVEWTGIRSSLGEWSGCTWVNVAFENALFIEDKFLDGVFQDVDCMNVKFERCNLQRVMFATHPGGDISFQDSTLKGCDLTALSAMVSANNCRFESCTFSSLNTLSACRVSDSKLENIDLREAALIFTTFRKTRFVRAKLSLSPDCLDGTRFIQVDFSGVTIDMGSAQKWRNAPEFIAAKGLSEEVVRELQRRGAVFRDRLPSNVDD